jgi:hypothetical protein
VSLPFIFIALCGAKPVSGLNLLARDTFERRFVKETNEKLLVFHPLNYEPPENARVNDNHSSYTAIP